MTAAGAKARKLHFRAQIAALTRAAAPDVDRLREAYAGLAEARIAECIEETVESIAQLSTEARVRLAVLLLTGGDR